eukprot:TRINITY_DN967_c0_g2_i1.p1 TRINITY_DN967_c0_g2~~TRINITY_DN967_c0_g2_i1.p1  ORF type:complete len:140 (-),score=37.00 TRINITY_DN967_c0_g2_i1:104-523(-)
MTYTCLIFRKVNGNPAWSKCKVEFREGMFEYKDKRGACRKVYLTGCECEIDERKANKHQLRLSTQTQNRFYIRCASQDEMEAFMEECNAQSEGGEMDDESAYDDDEYGDEGDEEDYDEGDGDEDYDDDEYDDDDYDEDD